MKLFVHSTSVFPKYLDLPTRCHPEAQKCLCSQPEQQRVKEGNQSCKYYAIL